MAAVRVRAVRRAQQAFQPLKKRPEELDAAGIDPARFGLNV
ncbi:hypothetical protein AB0B40_25890 [Streptomyces sp. NPDC042638]